MIDPKAGETWFNLETLTPVTVDEIVLGYGDAPDHVNFFVGDDAHGGQDLPQFLANYAVDEPLTLAVLERLGWEVAATSADVRAKLKLGDGDGRLLWTPDSLSHMAADNWSITTLAPVTTLRELLNVLRVFCVEVNP